MERKRGREKEMEGGRKRWSKKEMEKERAGERKRWREMERVIEGERKR